MGPKGGFSYFAFKQLYETRQFSKLLRLGEEFHEELYTFLKQHSDLLWLHQIFLHQFSSASETLHALALSQDEKSISMEEGPGNGNVVLEPTFTERKRLLNLSKIAAMAGKDAEYVMKVKRIDADLKLLKLQEEIKQLIFDDEAKLSMEQRLLHPEDLIKLCLKDQTTELTLYAFEVFAWTDSTFRKYNKSLLEQCWKSAADQDDWGKLYEASIAEGWTDEDTLNALRETILFQASSRCYGPEVETYEGGFDEVLPLRQENVDQPILKDSGSSVESILMQHRDFSDTGKLMLTAIMLGSAQSDILADDGPLAME